jgi:two-component system cell cycle response regulator DivK
MSLNPGAPPVHANGHNAAKTVLIVEDDAKNMRLVCDLLELRGYVTLQSTVGLEALKIARTRRPDLILMDMQLPDVSGIEVTKRFKADGELNGIPIVALTAFAMKGDRERMLQAGCSDYIAKPIFIDPFMKLVERFVG